jgi:8-oxo-dGTP diphosphatase
MKRPKVGIGVAIRCDDHVLLGLRKGRHAAGMWGFAGGHLEGGESFEHCVIRETAEETGIRLVSAKLWTVENVVFWTEDKHYVTILMVADMPTGQDAINREPEKCELWDWFPWDNLPTPLMPAIESVVRKGLSPIGV